MAGRRTRARKTGGGRGPRAAERARPVLGNDPFERGAAPRATTAERAPEPGPEPGPEPPVAAAVGTPPPEAPAEPTFESVRSHLSVIESRVESAAADATSRLRELERQEATGQHARDAARTAVGLLPALRERLVAITSLGSLLAGGRDLDRFGLDRELARRAAPILDFLYARWWRVEARQIDNVPATGPVVLVANHGGLLPWDALVLRAALLRDHRAHRADARPLLDDDALGMPVFGRLLTRLGAVAANPDDALRLVESGAVIAIFPEGNNAARRPWPDRYRVQRFGRGGFAKIALRSGAPIVPCAIVGSEETSLPMARSGWLSAVLGMPFLESPAAVPLAALGVIPLPARWSLRFGPPLETAPRGPDAARDPAQVLEVTERVRSTLQQMLDEDVAARGSVYL